MNARTGTVAIADRVFAVVQAGSAAGISLAEAVDLPGYMWTTGGHGTWFGQGTVTKDAADAAQSGVITHNQQSYVQAVFYGPGTISFWWKVASEPGYDFLHVLVNGVTNESISGVVDWQFRTLTLTNGPHLVRWVYSKDVSLSRNGDTAWLDMVQPATALYFTNGLTRIGPSGLRLELRGNPSSTVILQTSSNLGSWSPAATSSFSPAGVLLFTNAAPDARRFYRAVLP
jgi:hypothetical protein